MLKITFSHNYKKLASCTGQVIYTAKLIEVVKVDLADLSKDFLDYDTEGLYKFPKIGIYLILIFQKPRNVDNTISNIFTTIRRNTEEKERFYRSSIGKIFDIVNDEEGK
jgi:hypothetical protein